MSCWSSTLFRTNRIGDLACHPGNQSLHGIALPGPRQTTTWLISVRLVCVVVLRNARTLHRHGDAVPAAPRPGRSGCLGVGAAPPVAGWIMAPRDRGVQNAPERHQSVHSQSKIQNTKAPAPRFRSSGAF
jgi:hypothetical protein